MNACQVNLAKPYTEKKAEHESTCRLNLNVVHLINQKMNVFIIENKTASKRFAEI